MYGTQYGPAHKILVFIAYMQVPLTNAHVGKTSEARGLNFVLSLHQHPYLLSVSICTDLREALMLPDAISTEISCPNPLYIREI